jgi:hypothetical protein
VVKCYLQFPSRRGGRNDRSAVHTPHASRPRAAGAARFDPPPRPSGPISIRDDAYHYQDYASSPGAFWYTEWWYFNFHDPATGIDGICTFAVFNPGDKDFLGAASLTACVFVPGETMADPVIEYFELSDWSASYDKCDVTLGKSHCEALDAQTYRVTVSTSDGGILLDLTYTQADAPQFLAHDVHGKDEPWEVSSWLVYMPSARVSGTVLYRGRTYRLQNAVGYHDHDWGMWHVYAKTWSWAYMSSPDSRCRSTSGSTPLSSCRTPISGTRACG